jgi:hypothetical protein
MCINEAIGQTKEKVFSGGSSKAMEPDDAGVEMMGVDAI